MKIVCILLFFLVGCGSNYKGKEICGADEFVRDSYKINEGKFSILEMEGTEFDQLSPEYLNEYKDTVGNGDILAISIYNPKREDVKDAIDKISGNVGFFVSEGRVTLPNLGDVDIGNLTLEEAKEKLKKRFYSEMGETDVFLSYKFRTERKVELAGLVGLSSVPVDGKVRLFDVLSQAGVPVDANFFKSYVIRAGKLIPVDLYKLLKEGDMSQNIVMRAGDKVYIAEPASASLMVMGEVGSEKVISLPYGSVSLRMALAEAGGIPYTGDRSYIQVIRGNITHPKIYLLSWDHIINLPNKSLLLMPGDIVFVASKPITEWNRFMSQILPGFAGVEAAIHGVKSVGVIVP